MKADGHHQLVGSGEWAVAVECFVGYRNKFGMTMFLRKVTRPLSKCCRPPNRTDTEWVSEEQAMAECSARWSLPRRGMTLVANKTKQIIVPIGTKPPQCLSVVNSKHCVPTARVGRLDFFNRYLAL